MNLRKQLIKLARDNPGEIRDKVLPVLKISASFPDLSDVWVTPEIEEIERAWAGGIADFGDPRAAMAIRRVRDYPRYQKSLEQQLRKKLGGSFVMYRATPRDEYEDLLDGFGIGYKGFTTVLRVAKSWSQFAAHSTPEGLVVIKAIVRPDFVIMRGKASEAELVVNTSDLDGATLV